MKLSNNQQRTIDKAITLLVPFSKESVSVWTGYFEEQDEYGDSVGSNDFRDYDVCDNDDCLNHNHEILKKEYPRLNIQYRWYSNDGDKDKFENCSVCGRYLNEFLTWTKEDINHHIEYTRLMSEFQASTNAFEISGLLYSLNWSVDFARSENQQRAYLKSVIKYAEHIIRILNTPTPSR